LRAASRSLRHSRFAGVAAVLQLIAQVFRRCVLRVLFCHGLQDRRRGAGIELLQHPSGEWGWVRFVLVYADANPTWPRLARTYQGMLVERSSFATKTFDELLAADALDVEIRDKLVERYRCWSAAGQAESDRGAAMVPEIVR
jgi:hypothetical protein